MSRPGRIRFLSRTAGLYDPVVRGLGFPPLWEGISARAAPAEDEDCLDVCTGTGGLALALARRGARVVGVDAAPGLVTRAGAKARRLGLSGRTRFVVGDARALGFPDASFPLVTCCMALHEMAEAERARVLAELARVARHRVWVADYRVPSGRVRGLWFRVRHVHEYLESDDFEGWASVDPTRRLAAAGLHVEAAWDAGSFRVWPCRVAA